MPLFRLLAAPRSTRSVKIHAIPITTIFQRNCCYILVRSVHTRRQVAATYMSRRHGSDRELLRVYATDVAATSRTNSVWLDFLPLVAATKFCFGDKDFHKNSPVHTKLFVAATCRLTLLLQLVARPVHMEWSVAATCCCNLSPSVHVYGPTAAFWTNFCITSVSNFSWVLLTVVPREIEDNKYATFRGVNRSCIMVYVKMVNIDQYQEALANTENTMT